MDDRQNLLGKSPDKPKMDQAKMNDRYLTGLILLLTVVVVSNFRSTSLKLLMSRCGLHRISSWLVWRLERMGGISLSCELGNADTIGSC